MQQKMYEVTLKQRILDLSLLMDGIFEGEMKRGNEAILLTFTNGQKFRLIVKEE